VPASTQGTASVKGLTPAQLKAALTAGHSAALKRRAASAEQVTVTAGQERAVTVWRVTIPGNFPLRSARATVFVGQTEVGVGLTPPAGDALVAVTLDGAGLRDGAAVSYRWGGGPPISAGPLQVVG
jgi:protein involved in polysaccharide export with SLBB domain